MSQRVTILSQKSLLADGIASLLREDTHLFEVIVFSDLEGDNVIDELRNTKPVIILIDSFDLPRIKKFPLTSLLELFPNSMIIQINSNSDKIQIYKSEQWRVPESDSLFSILQKAIAQ